jgi:tRNA modification GTPase
VTDTIFARATAAGRAAVAIIRLSGPRSGDALKALSARELPRPRYAVVRQLQDAGHSLIDEALVLWMPGPASFTGEDCAELQVHGGPAVLEALASRLAELGLRSAEPGEFTRRAFSNGKLDLLQAEAVADLVDAQTEGQRRQALSQMGGVVGRRYASWREQLIEALAFIEAENDFPDEDLPGALAERARPLIQSVLDDLHGALASAGRGRSVREGYRIALVGAPNAGKSSLFNALVGRDAAIVSRHAGTTRDVVEAELVVAGYRVTLADTAGIRDSAEEIEAEGIRRARAWAQAADWRLIVVDPADPGLEELGLVARAGDLLVLTKSDTWAADTDHLVSWGRDRQMTTANSSTVVSDGVQQLRRKLEDRIVRTLESDEPALATRARHEAAVREGVGALERALSVLLTGPERAAEDVRQAVRSVQAVVGDVDHEAVLDRVFSSFCIGK